MLLVIVDEEEEYLEGISHYFQECFKQYFDVYAFQNKEALLQFTKEKEKEIAVLLGSVYFTPKETKELKVQQCIYLSAGERIADTCTEQSVDVIYKYQPAEVLVKEFVKICRYPDMVVSGNLTTEIKIYGVYSPVGRCGKTSLALALGMFMAEEQRTLYVSLEEWPGFARILGEYQGLDLSDLIYYSKQGKQNVGMYLNGMLQVIQGLKILPPVKCAPDIQEMTEEEFWKVLQDIKQTGEFEAIIIDFGHQVKFVLRIMERLERLYMPVLKDEVSQAKQEEFLNFMEHSDYKKYQEKLVICKQQGTDNCDMENVQELCSGSFGAYVRGLLEKER